MEHFVTYKKVPKYILFFILDQHKSTCPQNFVYTAKFVRLLTLAFSVEQTGPNIFLTKNIISERTNTKI